MSEAWAKRWYRFGVLSRDPFGERDNQVLVALSLPHHNLTAGEAEVLDAEIEDDA